MVSSIVCSYDSEPTSRDFDTYQVKRKCNKHKNLITQYNILQNPLLGNVKIYGTKKATICNTLSNEDSMLQGKTFDFESFHHITE